MEWMYHSFSIHKLIDFLGCFLVITNKTTINIRVRLFCMGVYLLRHMFSFLLSYYLGMGLLG